MTTAQERLLAGRLQKAIEQQPEILSLNKILLGIGGLRLVAPPQKDSVIKFLIIGGFVMGGSVLFRKMEEGACHANLAQLWNEPRNGLVGIGTGCALSEDGLWRQHSWGLRREGILETTLERTKYFGILLQKEDADSFTQANKRLCRVMRS